MSASVDAVGGAVGAIGALDPPRGATATSVVVTCPKEERLVSQAVVIDLDVEAVGSKGVRDQRPSSGLHRHGPRADTGGEVVVRLQAEALLRPRLLAPAGSVPMAGA